MGELIMAFITNPLQYTNCLIPIRKSNLNQNGVTNIPKVTTTSMDGKIMQPTIIELSEIRDDGTCALVALLVNPASSYPDGMGELRLLGQVDD